MGPKFATYRRGVIRGLQDRTSPYPLSGSEPSSRSNLQTAARTVHNCIPIPVQLSKRNSHHRRAIPCQHLGCAPQHVMDFFLFSVVVDNDEIWKSWNFEHHSPYRFPAGAIKNLGGSPSETWRGANDEWWCWEGHKFVWNPPQLWKFISRGTFWCRIQIWHQQVSSSSPSTDNEASKCNFIHLEPSLGGQNSKTNNIFIVNIPVNQRHRIELSTCTIKNTLDK